MKRSSFQYAQLRGWAILGLLLLVLLLLGGMAWRNLARFEALHAYASYGHRIQQVGSDLQEMASAYLIFRNKRLDSDRLTTLSKETRDLAQNDRHAAPDTPAKLTELGQTVSALIDETVQPEQQESLLLHALNLVGAMMDAETMEREMVLEDIGQSTRAEAELAFAIVAILLILAGLFIRFRILAPLHDLKELLLRLAQEDYTPIEVANLDPLLVPVFNSYNEMVRNLAELEETKSRHAKSLEAEVRSATRALLEQQADLARNERLAAVGELAAGIAHELRNPLAGIQMSCVNLRGELANEDQCERMSLVIEELKRMARLLNELLDHSQHSPAPSRQFDLPNLIRELVALTRYQIPPEIELRVQAPEHLLCWLPESPLRQSLLNLVLNSAQALGNNGGAIVIDAHRSGGRIELSVTDTGPGFSEETLAAGVRPFVTGRSGGTGLGLAIVQRFVRDVGGKLSLSNAEPHGACVRLTIPLHFA